MIHFFVEELALEDTTPYSRHKLRKFPGTTQNKMSSAKVEELQLEDTIHTRVAMHGFPPTPTEMNHRVRIGRFRSASLLSALAFKRHGGTSDISVMMKQLQCHIEREACIGGHFSYEAPNRRILDLTEKDI
jgi:hypothetical protein